jgi:type VI secretion system protein ImpM
VNDAQLAANAPAQPGFFGKLPARGDFVGRRLDQAFRTQFDLWLQRAIATSKRQLGTAWLPAYLNTPIWRFVLGPGLCGAVPTLGVMMPSVDRVGRYFPLVIAAQLPGCLSPGSMFQSAHDWFDRAEQLILHSLDDDFDLDHFDADVMAMGVPSYARAGDENRGGALRMDLHEGGDMAPTYARILDQVLMGNNVPFSLWWTQGSERVRPSVLLSAGLPAATNFAAFLDGQWDEWGWARPGDGQVTIQDMPVLMLKPVAVLASAGRTHPGTRRRINEDAMLLRADLGLWAVADGVGGHQQAAEASQTVVSHLEEFLAPLSFGGAVDDLRELLTAANAALRTRASGIAEHAIIASTIVVLLAYGGHFCLLWSGDSRGYRLRQGNLECLTRDHALSKGGAVTHAVGAEETLFLDQVHGKLEPGDCFMLCSDGLIKALDDTEIARALAGTQMQTVAGTQMQTMADTLLQDALVSGARDNVSVVVVLYPPA